MDISTAIAAIICSILGSGGLATVLTVVLSSKKYKAEARKIDNEASNVQYQNDIAKFDFINKRLQEIADNAEANSKEYEARNDDLNKKMNQMNDKLQQLMEWVMYDNQKYRNWLENELRKFNPDIQFPECPPPPKIFGTDNN